MRKMKKKEENEEDVKNEKDEEKENRERWRKRGRERRMLCKKMAFVMYQDRGKRIYMDNWRKVKCRKTW